VPLNRPLGSLHFSRGAVISNRQARHDIIELPFKGRYAGKAVQTS
jgi:hypothetical protein